METHTDQGKTAAFTWGTSLVIPFFFHVIAIIYRVESILYLSSEAADSGNRAWGRHGWHCMKKKLGLPHRPKQLICNVLSCNGGLSCLWLRSTLPRLLRFFSANLHRGCLWLFHTLPPHRFSLSSPFLFSYFKRCTKHAIEQPHSVLVHEFCVIKRYILVHQVWFLS